MGVEDGQEGDRHDGGGHESHAAIKEARADEVDEPDRSCAEQCGQDACHGEGLAGVAREVCNCIPAEEPKGEDRVDEVREGGRVLEVVRVVAILEEADRPRDEMSAFVAVVDVGKAVADSPQPKPEGEGENGPEAEPPARHISRRPDSARPSVTSSAYSRSPPTGSPLASLVTRVRSRSLSARYAAVASPVMFGFVARTTSSTPFLSTLPRSSSIRRCCGSTPSSGESAPPRTW